ncbi:hypothetical protein BDF19DRAFT_424167 [Syncephalis fuscata]|nr:hypothetical protein BDF19DRAFT_424167 [Syncephalis fuscata]
MLSSVLALLLIVQPIYTIPRKVEMAGLNRIANPLQVGNGLNIPAEFDQDDEISWDQQLNGRNVEIICRVRTNLNNQFLFLQDLQRNQALLQNDPGHQYVLHPYASLILRGKLCFIMPQSSDNSLKIAMHLLASPDDDFDSLRETLSSSDKARATLPFFIKIIQSINYIHKVGWSGITSGVFGAVILNSNIKPIINVMEMQPKRIEFRNNAVVLVNPPKPTILYSPEWITNTKIDPRKADLWEIGEFLYLNKYSKYYLSPNGHPERTIRGAFPKISDIQPNTGDIKEQFKKFMPHFKKFIEESYRNAVRVDNNNRAVLLNTNTGLPTNIIATSPSPLKHIPLTPEILKLLEHMPDDFHENSPLTTHSRFLANGFFQLGIYCKVTSEYIQYPNEYGAILDMINKLLPVNVEERLTPEQYLSQINSNANANRLNPSGQQSSS